MHAEGEVSLYIYAVSRDDFGREPSFVLKLVLNK